MLNMGIRGDAADIPMKFGFLLLFT